MMDTVVRHAAMADLDILLEIYNHYVRETHVTFDIEPRSRQEHSVWLGSFAPQGRRQCFVVERDCSVVGWAASAPFKDRAAYETSLETSVYLAPGQGGFGFGRVLYSALFDALAKEDVHRVFGGIALPNDASVALHLAMGFRRVGTYHEVGRKFGKYWDVAWFEKAIA